MVGKKTTTAYSPLLKLLVVRLFFNHTVTICSGNFLTFTCYWLQLINFLNAKFFRNLACKARKPLINQKVTNISKV